MERLDPSVTVLIPTFARPDSLENALRSVFRQTGTALIREIVVADNDPQASAAPVVERLRAEALAPLIYIHAPTPGVATARNAGLKAAGGRYIAFLDDDETADPDWLAALHHVHLAFAADVTFGPVQGRTPGAAAWKRPYLERFFSRIGPASSGLIEAVYGCGNSLMTRATALAGPEPFDIAADRTGGEDDRLFSALRRKGARFAWAADARVDECSPLARTRLTYAFARAVSYGQSPSQLALRRGDLVGLAKWMVIGAGQAVVYGLGALLLLMLFNPRWMDLLDRAARGLGKTVWFLSFHFYGQGAKASAAKSHLSQRGETPSAAVAAPRQAG